ncbi:hypothetical protein [Streptomyces sp. NPDC001536]|uniref:hypothetical protein n=1 Tax=Streptomyces sp. NPDC001536 TaxID=3364583 RepID=UPI0036C78139
MPSSVTAGRNLYWDIVQRRAADFYGIAQAPDSQLPAVLPLLLQHTAEFGLPCTTHVAQMVLAAIVHEDCPADCRTPQGTVDLDALLPPDTSTATVEAVLKAAETQHGLFDMPLAEGMSAAEEQIEATVRARDAIQDALRAVPDGTAGRGRMIERFWELRDDPRALIAVSCVTFAAVQAVVARSH